MKFIENYMIWWAGEMLSTNGILQSWPWLLSKFVVSLGCVRYCVRM